jgi:UrcA family protein
VTDSPAASVLPSAITTLNSGNCIRLSTIASLLEGPFEEVSRIMMTREKRQAMTRMFPARVSMLGIVLLCSGVALAGPVSSPEAGVTVNYSDLNLSTQEGVLRLYRRIGTAARLACSDYDSAGLARQVIYRQCVNNAVDDAVRKVGSEKLTEVHLRNTPPRVPG